MEQEPIATEKKKVIPRDWLGSLIGLAVFLAGVYLVYTVFVMAKDMFAVPPNVALNVAPGKPIDVGKTGNSAVSIVLKFFLLLLMAGTGSIIANRGILLYSRARSEKN
jgi:hypothetical protein